MVPLTQLHPELQLPAPHAASGDVQWLRSRLKIKVKLILALEEKHLKEMDFKQVALEEKHLEKRGFQREMHSSSRSKALRALHSDHLQVLQQHNVGSSPGLLPGWGDFTCS